MGRKITINKEKNENLLFLEKEDDMSCIVKDVNSGEEIKGTIISISTNGTYTIEVNDGKDK